MFPDIKLIILIFLVMVIVILCIKEKKRKRQIQTIAQDISRIMERDSSEKIMSFTSEKEMKYLIDQINGLLENQLKVKADYMGSRLEIKRMLSNVSHDIKTPMTVILGYLEIMTAKQEDDNLLKVQKKANEVMELINKFFTLAKLEAGDMDFVMETININELCREIILAYYDILTGQDFDVDVRIPEESFYIYSSKEALERILNNLISNALRYGNDGKYLGLEVRREEDALYIDVTDKGRGIEASELSHIFDRMYTLEDSRNKNMQGNGLGLTIAKGMAERLGGSISVTSIPYKKTTFTLRIRQREL
ncbi:MAG: HAMP domain-containing histidine kinase [Lachnospiraceae bacterium]|nr:HAMP domain-containing histidine kinase [Lachnospiraceae bacterium]